MGQPYKPRGIGDLEFLHDRRLSNLWAFYSPHSLLEFLSPGFLDPLLPHGLQAQDKIEAICETDSAMPCHAVLLVDQVDPRAGIKVSLLVKYERQPENAVNTVSIDAAASYAPQATGRVEVRESGQDVLTATGVVS